MSDQLLLHLNNLETRYNEAQKKAERVSQLEQRLLDATRENHMLKNQLNQKQASAVAFSNQSLSELADTLISNGLLSSNNKLAFVNRCQSHPNEIIESFRKVAESTRAQQIGFAELEVNTTSDESRVDPITRWALSPSR